MSKQRKSLKLTKPILTWYIIAAALTLLLLLGHIVILFNAAGLFKLSALKFWLNGLYVYSPALIVIVGITYLLNRALDRNRPVKDFPILCMLAFPVILSVLRLIIKLCGGVYFMNIYVSWVFAVVQTIGLVLYIVGLSKFLPARKAKTSAPKM